MSIAEALKAAVSRLSALAATLWLSNREAEAKGINGMFTESRFACKN